MELTKEQLELLELTPEEQKVYNEYIDQRAKEKAKKRSKRKQSKASRKRNRRK